MPYKHDYDKAMTRLSIIINKLYEGQEISIKELADEFGCSTKTIQRDLSQRLISFPIERNGNKFKMMEGHRLEKRFDPQDMLVLDVLERMSESIGSNFAQRAKSLLGKLKNEDNNPIYTKVLMEDISKKANEVTTLESAIKSKNEIGFVYEYEGQKLDFDVKPLKVVCFDGFWYLLGMDSRNDIIKKYYLNNISNIKIKEAKFKILKDIEDRLNNAINIWFDANIEPFKIRLHIQKEVAKYLHRRPLAKSQIIESVNGDGSLDIALKITEYNEIIPIVLYWLPNIKVIEPKELDLMVRERVGGY